MILQSIKSLPGTPHNLKRMRRRRKEEFKEEDLDIILFIDICSVDFDNVINV